MLDRQTLQKLGNWQGHRLERVIWPQDGGTVELHLKPTANVMHCQRCGARCRQVHETSLPRVRDLPLFERRVVLVAPRRRVWCDHCGGRSWRS